MTSEDNGGRSGRDQVVTDGSSASITVNGETIEFTKEQIQAWAAAAGADIASGRPQVVGVGIGDNEELRRAELMLIAAHALNVAPPNAGDVRAAIDRQQGLSEKQVDATDAARLIYELYVRPAMVASELNPRGGLNLLGRGETAVERMGAIPELLSNLATGLDWLGLDEAGKASHAAGSASADVPLVGLVGILAATPGGRDVLRDHPELWTAAGGASGRIAGTIAELTDTQERLEKRLLGDGPNLIGRYGGGGIDAVHFEPQQKENVTTGWAPPVPIISPWVFDPRDYQGPRASSHASAAQEADYSARIGGQLTPSGPPPTVYPSFADPTLEDYAGRGLGERLVWEEDHDTAIVEPSSTSHEAPSFYWDPPDEGATYALGPDEPGAPPSYSFDWPPEDLGATWGMDAWVPEPVPSFDWPPEDEGATWADYDYWTPPEPPPAPAYDWPPDDEGASYSL